jgi:uncharacterized protein YqgV (UPF0045/DUF77 family)
MSQSIDELLSHGLECLRLLGIEKNKLAGIRFRGCRQLCSTAHESFYLYFNDLKMNLTEPKNTMITVSLEIAVELLREIQQFICECSSDEGISILKFSKKTGHRVIQLAEFNYHLKEVLKKLGLQVRIDPEEKWEPEEVTEYVAMIVVEILQDHRDESRENQLQFLKVLKQLLADTIKGIPSATLNSLVDSVTNCRDGVCLDSIYVYDPFPKLYHDKGHILGRGAFATTVRVRSTQDNKLYAMK